MVWDGYDATDNEIYMYDGTNINQLTNNALYEHGPQINNNGEVVWRGSDGTDYEIYMYDGISTTQITNNAYTDGKPEINNNGEVVWSGYDGSDYEVFLAVYDDSDSDNIPTPEPTTMLIFGLGLLGVAGVRRKRQ